LQLDGVEPNNVFWVIPRLTPNPTDPATALTIRASSVTPLDLATVSTLGTGYTVGDILTVSGGTLVSGGAPKQLTVTSRTAGGGITGITVSSPGSYLTLPTNPVIVTGGSGTLARFNLTSTPIVVGGSGYTVGTLLDVTGGTLRPGGVPTRLRVTSRNGTAITGVSVVTPGSYSTFPANPVSVTSTPGTGATFNLFPATVLSGNFLGISPATGSPLLRNEATTLNIQNSAVLPSGINVSLRGTRFLGFRALVPGNATTESSDGISPQALVAAMTTINEPIVLPVLQLHSPTALAAGGATLMPQPINPANNESMTGNTDINPSTGQWTQRATNSEINVYFVAGNTPSRSKVDYTTSIASNLAINLVNPNTTQPTAETGGGLGNFIRLVENWTNKNLKIVGGFIQNTKSSFGTAPFSNTAPYGVPSNPSFTSDIQTLFINPVDNTRAIQPLSSFKKVYQSGTGQRIPFYAAPNRLWGFDVGLLTQSADRFAERFAAPIPGANEFLRQVDANDPWVKALLCAAQPPDLNAANSPSSAVNPGQSVRLGTVPSAYTARALGGDSPSDCTDAPLTYN